MISCGVAPSKAGVAGQHLVHHTAGREDVTAAVDTARR